MRIKERTEKNGRINVGLDVLRAIPNVSKKNPHIHTNGQEYVIINMKEVYKILQLMVAIRSSRTRNKMMDKEHSTSNFLARGPGLPFFDLTAVKISIFSILLFPNAFCAGRIIC